jgi:predicted Zn-dependent protease
MDRADLPLVHHMRKLLMRGLLAAGVLTGLFGCKGAINNMDIGQMVQGGGPALRAANMSEKDEDSLGQSIAIKATNTYGLYGDDGLTRYVELVGEVVATASPRPDLMYRYAILKSDTEINAFSGPHGYILITHGLLLQIHNEAELAGVLAHETTHICNHDGLEAAKKAGEFAGLTQVASGAARTQAYANAAGSTISEVMESGYDKDQEFAADAGAVKMMAAAKYDPHQYLNFLIRLQTLSAAKGGGIMSTHPGLPDRIKKVQDAIKKLGTNAKGEILQDRWVQYTHIGTVSTSIDGDDLAADAVMP